MNERPCSIFFNLLSTRSRIDIVTALYDGEKSVSELCKAVKVERTNVSHQLKLLRECSFVFVRREGKKRIYSLNLETVKPILDLANRHVEKYCKLRRRKRACSTTAIQKDKKEIRPPIPMP